MSTRDELCPGPSLVLTQPMLLPWHGLISQFVLADRIVILDDAQLPAGGGAGRGFITRVQIKTPRGTDWLSIPVQRARMGKQRICDALVGTGDWRRQHLARIKQAYGGTPCFPEVFEEVIQPTYANPSPFLVDFLVGGLARVASALGIRTALQRTSQGTFAQELGGSARVLAICRLTGARRYLTGHGGMAYLDHEAFEAAGVKVHYMSYELRPYPQLHGTFTPRVSILDLLCAVGPATARSHLLSVPVYWRRWPHLDAGRLVPHS
jgi:hypothetical protein